MLQKCLQSDDQTIQIYGMGLMDDLPGEILERCKSKEFMMGPVKYKGTFSRDLLRPLGA